MNNGDRYFVRIDHLSDDDLAFRGWINVESDDEFTVYWSPHCNDHQVVQNKPPRYLVVDDINDVIQMSKDGSALAIGE